MNARGCRAMHCGVAVPTAGLLASLLPSECVLLLFILGPYVLKLQL
jgi:hypothetical protein